MNKSLFSAIVIFLLFSFNSCKNENEPVKGKTTHTSPQFKKEGELTFISADSVASKKIEIEVAATDAEQQEGLMNRPWMEESQGMLFIFNDNTERAFWMKNTIMALDIIYVNSNKQIVTIAKNCQPFSEKNIPSYKPAQYVIEVIAGFTDKYNIKEGDRCTWQLL